MFNCIEMISGLDGDLLKGGFFGWWKCWLFGWLGLSGGIFWVEGKLLVFSI